MVVLEGKPLESHPVNSSAVTSFPFPVKEKYSPWHDAVVMVFSSALHLASKSKSSVLGSSFDVFGLKLTFYGSLCTIVVTSHPYRPDLDLPT